MVTRILPYIVIVLILRGKSQRKTGLGIAIVPEMGSLEVRQEGGPIYRILSPSSVVGSV
jgi:hypothetical protein